MIYIKKGFQQLVIFTIKDENGTAIDLTSYDAVKFVMVSEAGTVKVNQEAAAFVSKPNGQVSYTFAALNVDTPGLYKAYFQLYIGAVKKLAAPATHFDITITEDYLTP